jgi:putative membrane protein
VNLLRVWWAGLRSNFTSATRIITLACIVVVPTLYPLFYLQAFWDPYGNLDKLPIAVVNLDRGTSDSHLGADLLDTLATERDVDWVFTGREAADAGLDAGTFYAVFTIPADFSAALEAGRTGNARKGVIQLRTNSKNSFMSSLLAQQIATRICGSVSEKVASSYVDSILEGISEGAAKLVDGAETLNTSAAKQSDSVAEFAAKVDDLRQHGVAEFIADPVAESAEDTNPVPNYGTGFAPYFLSLSGWIGALLIAMTVGNRLRREPTGAGPIAGVLGRYLACLCVGIVQACLLVGVIAALGIQPASWPGLLGMLLAGSATSIAIVSTLVGLLGRLGQLCAMVVLVFQLTCSGGTFPTPLTNGALFTDMHPYVSFTYSVQGLREVISALAVNWNSVWADLGALAIFTASALALHAALEPVLNRLKRRLRPQSA